MSISAALLSPAEQRVVEAVDPVALAADLAELVGFGAVGGTPGETAVQRWGAARLRSLGLLVDEWDIDVVAEAAEPGFPGMEVTRDAGVGVVGVLGAGGPGAELPALALCGHTDVVPAGDLRRWGGDPFTLRREGPDLVGRGVCDMLGGVAAVLAAAGAVAACGPPLRRPLAVHLVSGEEDGGFGAFATLRRGHRAEACLIAEPTDGAVVPANAGSLTFRLVVAGRATHGSTRTRGVSAIDQLASVQAALRDLEARRNAVVPQLFSHLDLACPISVGVVRAGDWASTVPDLLVAEGRYGVLPGESVESARATFESALAEAGAVDPWLRDHPVEVTWPGGAFAPGAMPEGHPFLGETVAAALATGTPDPAVLGAPYGSDLRHYAAHGIPALQFGPGQLRQAHAADERVDLAEVVRCARAYAVLALRRCG